ncbi:nickel insertion protein [Streptomyces sp. NPDC086787]|uniref:nickel insertion protein n=1 Tax=Streptomyces sp. NPDC086787 TaxID=3365759 RepID=UPI003810CED7
MDREEVREAVVTETPTIGTRAHPVQKHEREREFTTVALGDTEVRIKVARHRRRIVDVQPEYEDVAAAADQLGVPLKTAPARSVAAAETALGKERSEPWTT